MSHHCDWYGVHREARLSDFIRHGLPTSYAFSVSTLFSGACPNILGKQISDPRVRSFKLDLGRHHVTSHHCDWYGVHRQARLSDFIRHGLPTSYAFIISTLFSGACPNIPGKQISDPRVCSFKPGIGRHHITSHHITAIGMVFIESHDFLIA